MVINNLNFMKNKHITLAIIIGLFSMIFVSCEDNIPAVIDQMQFDRVFTPLNFQARIRNMTTAELSWDERGDAQAFVVQISQDSLVFDNIIETDTITPEQNPFSTTLDGNTRYSARLKGISDSISESKWTMITFKTDPENIFVALADSDIHATSVTLRWPAGSTVTNFVITPGDINRTITDQEKADGVATIAGLTGDTQYSVTLYNGTKIRGTVQFKTQVDIGNATAVHPTDDLAAVIAAAKDGDVLALFPGEYTASAGDLTIDKSISIKAVYSYDPPVLHNQINIADGAMNVVLDGLVLNGSYTDSTNVEVTLSSAIQYNTTDFATLGSLTVTGCTIDTYEKSFISDGGSQFKTDSIIVNNCIVSNVYNSGGDFIDSRKSFIAKLTVTNSTFNNCATLNTRDFIRMDGGTKGNTYDDGTNMPVINVNHCTLNNVMNSSSSTKRMFYVRWSQNQITSENNLLTDMGISVYSNQSATSQPACAYNNYFNADGYFTVNGTVLIDNSSNYTTEDPGYTDAANGDFTISNQTLIDNQVGDPRWLPAQ
jgi:hypothetical protein